MPPSTQAVETISKFDNPTIEIKFLCAYEKWILPEFKTVVFLVSFANNDFSLFLILFVLEICQHVKMAVTVKLTLVYPVVFAVERYVMNAGINTRVKTRSPSLLLLLRNAIAFNRFVKNTTHAQ